MDHAPHRYRHAIEHLVAQVMSDRARLRRERSI